MEKTNSISLPMYNLEKHPSKKNSFETIYDDNKKSNDTNLSNSQNYENWLKPKKEEEIYTPRPMQKRNNKHLKKLDEILDKLRKEQKEKGDYFNNNNNNMTVKNKNKRNKPTRKPLRKNNNKKTNKKLIRSRGSRKSLSYSSVLFSPKPVKKIRPTWKPPGNANKIRLG
jgi:hypothetical protein